MVKSGVERERDDRTLPSETRGRPFEPDRAYEFPNVFRVLIDGYLGGWCLEVPRMDGS